MKRSYLLTCLLALLCLVSCAEEKKQIVIPVVGQQMNDFKKYHDERMAALASQFPDLPTTALEAFQTTPRAFFVADLARHRSYEDQMLPIGSEQVTLKLSDIAWLITSLKIAPTDIVFEVGTGTGYMTTILARTAKFVYTMDINEYLADIAMQNLQRFKVENIKIKRGLVNDGLKGWPARAPFDVVIITAAVEKFPDALIPQLKDGARVAAPIIESAAKTPWRLYRLNEDRQLVEYAHRNTNIPPAVVIDDDAQSSPIE